MSATMARQGGRVQLEQSDMRLALNMAKMAKEGFSCAAIEETQQLIKQPCAKVWDEMKRSVVFSRLNRMNAAIQRHPAMFHENQTYGCPPCQNGTANNRQTCWGQKSMGAPTPLPLPPRPRMPPAPPDDSERTGCSGTEGVPARYVHIHTPLHSCRLLNLDPYPKDHMHDIDSIPDLLTDDGPSRS